MGEVFRPSLSSAAPTTNATLFLSVQDSSYHLNDLALSSCGATDAYELPTPERARCLFAVYMSRVDPNFPILGRLNLQNQFANFMARPGVKPPSKWLAILNLIFAIGAKYSCLVRPGWQANEADDLIYFTRARLLALNGETLLHHPDLQMIQILGLASHYLL